MTKLLIRNSGSRIHESSLERPLRAVVFVKRYFCNIKIIAQEQETGVSDPSRIT
jgi:hypothetical protein